MPLCPNCGYRAAMKFTVKTDDGERVVVPCIKCEKEKKNQNKED